MLAKTSQYNLVLAGHWNSAPNNRCIKSVKSWVLTLGGRDGEISRQGWARTKDRPKCYCHLTRSLPAISNSYRRPAGSLGFCFKGGRSVLQTENIFSSKMGRKGWHSRLLTIWTQVLQPFLDFSMREPLLETYCSFTVSQIRHTDLRVYITGCKLVAQLPNPGCRLVLFDLCALYVVCFLFPQCAHIWKSRDFTQSIFWHFLRNLTIWQH